MSRTLLLGLIFVVLAGTIGFLAWKKSSKAKAQDDYEGNFAIENPDDIGRIVIEQRAGNTYTLTRDDQNWLVNETHRARMSSVKPLLDALRMVEIRYIPSDKALPNVMENIEGTWIHAEIYDRGGKKLKAYRIGGVTPDERGTYMIMDGSKQPFVVHIPSWDGALRTRFSLEMADWRDRHFMNIDPQAVASVTVTYPQQKSQSFKLEKNGDSYALSAVYPELRDYSKNYRNGTAEAFIAELANAACEGFENQYPLKDSVRNEVPFCQMEIKLRDEVTPVQVRLWPKGPVVYSENAPPVHRLFLERSPGDFVLVQYDVIKGMLRGYDYFTGDESQLVL